MGQYAQVGEIKGPASWFWASLNPNWQTIRIPVSAFPANPADGKVTAAVVAAKLHGVGFTFNKTNTGAIYLADVRFSTFGSGLKTFPPSISVSRSVPNEFAANAWGGPSIAATPGATLAATPGAMPTPSQTQFLIHPATVDDVTAAADYAMGSPVVEIQLSSDDGFPAVDEEPVLTIGGNAFDFTGQAFDSSGYARSDDGTIIFTLTVDQYTSALNEQSSAGGSSVEVYVHYGEDPSYEVWDLGQVTLPSLSSLGIEPTPTPVVIPTPVATDTP